MSTPTAFPLSWPNGWPRTEEREKGKFSSTLAGALDALRIEVVRLGGTDLVLSSNYTLGSNNPEDPGVVAYFTYEKASVAIPCDRWLRIEHNVKAIALTIEAMRGMERWGAKHMIKAMFSGFKALPASSSGRKKRHWTEVMQLDKGDDRQFALKRYRELAQARHPDAGGSNEAMSELNVAWEECQRERGWKS